MKVRKIIFLSLIKVASKLGEKEVVGLAGDFNGHVGDRSMVA